MRFFGDLGCGGLSAKLESLKCIEITDQKAGRVLWDHLVQPPHFTEGEVRPRDGRRVFPMVTQAAAELGLTPDFLLPAQRGGFPCCT